MSGNRRDPHKAKLRRERIRRQMQAQSSPKPPAFLSTHPPTTERIERLRKLWDDLERKNGFVDLERQLNEAPYPAE
jgi:predicted Zn-dependent protease